jgi:hypothetical protein
MQSEAAAVPEIKGFVGAPFPRLIVRDHDIEDRHSSICAILKH